MRVSCDLPNDQRVFPVLPQANQAVRAGVLAMGGLGIRECV